MVKELTIPDLDAVIDLILQTEFTEHFDTAFFYSFAEELI